MDYKNNLGTLEIHKQIEKKEQTIKYFKALKHPKPYISEHDEQFVKDTNQYFYLDKPF